MYNRIVQKLIESNLFKNKVILLYGARQVGKTTLVKNIIRKYEHSKYIDCDLIENRQALQTESLEKMQKYLGNYKLIVLDEAQRVNNIILNLKILHDNCPEMQIIATGSSSFELANQINEPLTGRAFEYMLFPLAIEETMTKDDYIDISTKLDHILRFGFYPEVFDYTDEDAQKLLNMISGNYLYKDILEFDKLKKSEQLISILQLLALQIGQEISFAEIGAQLGLSIVTVQKYIDLLEKSFVIFKLRGFSRNLRKEISKSVKLYFWDLGIRNSLIHSFNALNIRTDVGALWENFWIAERLKFNLNHQIFVNSYFWRTYDQKEIDYIEEANEQLFAFECKWSAKAKIKTPQEFLKTYKNSTFRVVTPDNFIDTVTSE